MESVACTQPCSDERPCFAHKLQFWRLNGGAPMQFSYGKEDFHGPSVHEREKAHVAELRAAGREFERA